MLFLFFLFLSGFVRFLNFPFVVVAVGFVVVTGIQLFSGIKQHEMKTLVFIDLLLSLLQRDSLLILMDVVGLMEPNAQVST